MRVLIVDDSQIMRRMITGVLKKIGSNDVVEAADAKQAIDALEKEKDIALVLMDWNMPGMTGMDAVRKIRTMGITIPVVMVTTEAEKEKVVEALKSGANDYLIKPFNAKSIQAKLEKFLQPCSR